MVGQSFSSASPGHRQAAARVGIAGAPAIASVWYRGTPAGTPRAEDLSAIRAAGFESVTWPSKDVSGAPDLYRLAASFDLQVTLRVASVPLTPESAKKPDQAVDINVASTKPDLFGALAWRAVAHGARVVSFDAGTSVGTGLVQKGKPQPWVKAAAKVAADLSSESRLIEGWFATTDQPRLTGGVIDDLDMYLLNDDRSWILVVTNASRRRAHGIAHLPIALPGALWVNLLDGSLLSMINEPGGPRWVFDIAAGAARVYVVNK